jgi:hypothetical protein
MKRNLIASSALALLMTGGVGNAATEVGDGPSAAKFHNGSDALAISGEDSGSAVAGDIESNIDGNVSDDDGFTEAAAGIDAEADSQSTGSNESVSSTSDAHAEGTSQDSDTENNDGTSSEAQAESSSDGASRAAHAEASSSSSSSSRAD